MNDLYNNFSFPGRDDYPTEAFTNAGTQPIELAEPLITADDICYILFNKKDLRTQKKFLEDFGLIAAEVSDQALYMRAHGSQPYVYAAYQSSGESKFIGVGFSVKEQESLIKISDETGVPITPVEGPGAGKKVRLTDPDGFIVDVVWGRELVAEIPLPESRQNTNEPKLKRRVNTAVRSSPQPSAISRLGHYVISVTKFSTSLKWYSRHLGIIPTDVQCLEDGTPVLAFNRLNRGMELADHHTVVLVQSVAAEYMHSAFETVDIDSIGQGQQFLKHRGWTHFWGIGRHILGSQLFDYWLDPTGDELEHYADGDVFNSNFETQYHPMNLGSLWAWGQDLPPAMRPRLSLKQIIHAVKALKSGRLNKHTLGLMKSATSLPPRPWLK